MLRATARPRARIRTGTGWRGTGLGGGLRVMTLLSTSAPAGHGIRISVVGVACSLPGPDSRCVGATVRVPMVVMACSEGESGRRKATMTTTLAPPAFPPAGLVKAQLALFRPGIFWWHRLRAIKYACRACARMSSLGLSLTVCATVMRSAVRQPSSATPALPSNLNASRPSQDPGGRFYSVRS